MIARSRPNSSNKIPRFDRSTMYTRTSWLICEKTGRWAAAMRVALSRRSQPREQPLAGSRIHEVRTFEAFNIALQESSFSIALVETTNDNLAAVLDLLARSGQGSCIVALLDESLFHDSRQKSRRSLDAALIANALSEAGASAIVRSPRHIADLLPLGIKCSASQRHFGAAGSEHVTFVDWARAALPWQDA
jgi:hypothetical protein